MNTNSFLVFFSVFAAHLLSTYALISSSGPIKAVAANMNNGAAASVLLGGAPHFSLWSFSNSSAEYRHICLML